METMIVEFGSSSEFAIFEVDGDSHKDKDGKERSQFYPGEEVVGRLHHDPCYQVTQVVPVKGSIVDGGDVRRTITEEIYFTGPLVDDGRSRTGELSLKYIPAGPVSVKWDGREGSGFSSNGRNVWVTGGYPCNGTVTYQVAFTLYLFIPPPMELGEGESMQINVEAYLDKIK